MHSETPSVDLIAELQSWYASECDGDWEHSYGITIETLDNPGWSLEIDLNETSLACRPKLPVHKHISDNDWLIVHITSDKFRASGDPRKLPQLLAEFLAFQREAAREEGRAP